LSLDPGHLLKRWAAMRVVSLVLAVLACTNAFTLTTAPPTMRVAVAHQLGGCRDGAVTCSKLH
jgi:hypothetical protein